MVKSSRYCMLEMSLRFHEVYTTNNRIRVRNDYMYHTENFSISSNVFKCQLVRGL